MAPGVCTAQYWALVRDVLLLGLSDAGRLDSWKIVRLER